MGLGLSVKVAHAQEQAPRFSRTFDRCPVLVGRDPEVANCVLPDGRVSRLHASFDIRDRWISVRDSGSTNGTFVDGQRIPFDRWVAVGGVNGRCEVRIAEWVLQVTTYEVDTTVPPDGADFLTALPPEPPRHGPAPPRLGNTLVVDTSALRTSRAWTQLLAARKELMATLADVLESTPPHQRAQVVRDLVQGCAAIEGEPGVRSLLERLGGQPLPHTIESGAALALHELARWYVNDQPPITNAGEVFAFARKLKAGIDELLLGLVPMFAGLDRFEHQVALRPHSDESGHGDMPPSSRLPRVPRDAARHLFNWRDPSDNAVRAVRTDLVDLTMHQVAVLNGVMRGVKQLLAELAPGTIEVALRKRLDKRGFLSRVFASFRGANEKWELYTQRHGDLADEENERFRVIFGPEFVAEYKQSGESVTFAGRASLPATLKPPDPQNRT